MFVRRGYVCLSITAIVNSPSQNGQGGDHGALGAAKKAGWVQKDGYGIVVGARSKTVTFYDENRDKVTIRLSAFLKIGK